MYRFYRRLLVAGALVVVALTPVLSMAEEAKKPEAKSEKPACCVKGEACCPNGACCKAHDAKSDKPAKADKEDKAKKSDKPEKGEKAMKADKPRDNRAVVKEMISAVINGGDLGRLEEFVSPHFVEH